MTRPRVAVTGASGLVGTWLCAALGEREADVLAVPREALADPEPVLQGADVVFHLAAQTIVADAWRDPEETFEVNVAGTWRVVAAAGRCGARRVVVASTDQVYGPHAPGPTREDHPLAPEGPYPASKAAADVLARSLSPDPPVVVARLANVYGAGDRQTSRLVPATIAAVQAGRRPLIRGSGTARRDLLHAEDAAAALIALAGDDVPPGEAYNVGTGRSHSVREVVEAVLRVCGSDLEPEVQGTEPRGEGGEHALDAGRLREVTGWTPRITLEEGLRRTIAPRRGLAAA